MLHQFTVAEADVRVESLSPALSDVVLGFAMEDKPDTPGVDPPELETFAADGIRIHPATDGLFAIGDDVYVFVQVREVPADLSLRLRFVDGEIVLEEQLIPAAELTSEPVTRMLSLVGSASGNYEVHGDLVDAAGTALLHRSAPVTVSPRTEAPRPAFTARRSFDPGEPGLLAMTLGDQLWSLGRFDAARVKLEEAVAAGNPELPMAKWKLAAAYVRERDGERALELLVPLEPEFPEQFEVILGLGVSYYLEGDLEKASEFLERAMTIRAPGTSLLNTLGDVYLSLGQSDKARPLLERSLELDGSQDAVREKLSTLPTG